MSGYKQEKARRLSALLPFCLAEEMFAAEKLFEKGKIMADAQNLVKLLAETPANHLTPKMFAEQIREVRARPGAAPRDAPLLGAVPCVGRAGRGGSCSSRAPAKRGRAT